MSKLDPKIEKKIEKAILKLFSTRDYHQVNMRIIAKVSGVSLGTIYKYYHGKDELLFFFIDKWSERIAYKVMEHLGGLELTQEKIRKVCWTILNFYETNNDIGMIFFLTIPAKTWMSHESFKQKKLTRLFISVLKEGQKKGDLVSTVRAGVLKSSFSLAMMPKRQEKTR